MQHEVRDEDADDRQPVAHTTDEVAAHLRGRHPVGLALGHECTRMTEGGPVPSAAMFVKICGVTNEEDALLAVALGADALGFNFAPGSPRQVTPETVGEILHRLPSG